MKVSAHLSFRAVLGLLTLTFGLFVVSGCSGGWGALKPTVTEQGGGGQGQTVAVTVGQPATFTSMATGTGPFTYQWYLNGVAINGGVNNLQDVLISENNQIQNNLIYNIGQLVGHGAGVHIEQSAANLVSHNEIHDGPRYGVNIVGSSDNPPTLHNLAANNVISHNKAYNLNTDSWDTGNFYQFAAGLNNLFDYNMSYNSYGGPSCTTNVNFYLDGGAQGATVSNSIGYNPTVLPFDSSLATTCNSSGDIINTACENSPNSTCTKNFVSIEAAVAAGLDITQMGRLPVNEPVPSVVAASLLLLLNNPAH